MVCNTCINCVDFLTYDLTAFMFGCNVLSRYHDAVCRSIRTRDYRSKLYGLLMYFREKVLYLLLHVFW